MDHSDESLPPLPHPPRMFALGEEPEGVRVTPYHKPTCILKILNALGPDEVRRIKETPGSSSGSERDCEDDDDFVDDDSERKKCINPVRVRDIDSSLKNSTMSRKKPTFLKTRRIYLWQTWRSVFTMVSFRKSHFLGGATLADVIRMREEAAKENNTRNKTKRSVNANSADAADPDYRNISNMIPTPSSGRHAYPPHAHQAETTFSREKTTTEPNPGAPPNVPIAPASDKRNKSTVGPGHFDPCGSIQDAIHFADHVAPLSGDVNMGDASLNEEGSPEKCNDGNNDLNPREEQIPPAYSSADGEAREVEEEDPEDAVDMINSPPLTQPAQSDFTEHANITTAGTGSSPAESGKQTSSTSSDSNPPPPIVTPQPSSCLDNAQSNFAFPKPTFSLGLTQKERYLSKTDLVDADESLEEGASISLNDDQEPFPANRKSKRQKVVPRSLVGDYHVIDVSGQSLDSSNLSAILARSSHLTAKVMDVLIHHTRSLIEALSEERQPSTVVLLDMKTDGMINKEIRPISEMFPFLLRRAARQVFSKNPKALTIERPRIVPQNHTHFDSGFTSILLIQAHAVAGLDL
ncbi:hypothetical protein DY000_02056947 [Brassica cretica]|uniref:Ubiquitin-like protease family profile domain-containing protein n=1 Tax=Brassica cretica TaxID=69181 RepID=A0ABQ7AAM2_BRACR|nr:hypothetical protein DY000_02056947 [Brassica cretica]